MSLDTNALENWLWEAACLGVTAIPLWVYSIRWRLEEGRKILSKTSVH